MTTPSPRCERHTRYAAKDELIDDCADCRALAESHAEADAGETLEARLAVIEYERPTKATTRFLVETVRAQQRAMESAREDTARIDWLDANAKHEIVINTDGDDIEVRRWVRKYITYHNAYGSGLRRAIDAFRASPVSGARTTGVGDGE